MTSINGKRFIVATALFLGLIVVTRFFTAAHTAVLSKETITASDSETRQQGKWPWWLSRAYVLRSHPPDIAVLGSSQIGAATYSADAKLLRENLDCVTYRKIATLEQELFKRTGQRFQVCNLSMGGEMVSDALLFSRALFVGKRNPGLVIIGISPRDFIDNDLSSPSATDPFEFLSPYVNLSDLSSAAYPNFFSYLGWLIDQNIPFKKEQANLAECLKQFANDRLPAAVPVAAAKKGESESGASTGKQKLLLQAISGCVGEVKPGEWIVPAASPPLFMDNTREYLHRYHDPGLRFMDVKSSFSRLCFLI